MPQEEKPFNLLRWFSIVSFFCVLLISATSAFLLSRFLTHNMLQREAVVAMEFVQNIAQIGNTSAYFEAGAPGEARGVFQDFVSRISNMPEVIRTNVYARDGLVVWSDDERFINHSFNPNPELETALLGQLAVASGMSSKSIKPEHVFDAVVPYFVEIYIPIWNKSQDRVVGVVEVYKVPITLLDATQKGTGLVWTSTLLGGLFLYASLFWIVRRGALVIRQQERRLIDLEKRTP